MEFYTFNIKHAESIVLKVPKREILDGGFFA
jgi:hypothetical protein